MTGRQGDQGQYCGFLNVLKPPGMSSAQVVGMARRFLCGAKVGHAGTLDPEAAGVLPLMVGKAARLFDYMQEKEKAYVAEIAFGWATDTQDAQGTIIQQGDTYPTEEALRAILPRFTGNIWQTPPMYSAIKQGGKRLYQLARDGKQAEVAPRQVTVHALALRQMMPAHGALVAVRSSKGFYVRTLCHDLGQALGCPAHMRFLLRIASGVFAMDTAHSLEMLADAAESGRMEELLLPVDTVLGHLPQAEVPKSLRRAVQTGGKLPWEAFASLHESPAADEETPLCLRLDGRVLAIAQRRGEELRLRTWLGE